MLVITEMMGSVLMLVAWDAVKGKVLDYVVPVWEVTGTFGAFWVVTSDFAYPSILIPLASIFSAAIAIFLILFVARNSTIVFAEFIKKKGWLDERKLYTGYSLSTLLLGLVVLVIITGIIGGNGIDLSKLTFSVSAWAGNAASWLFIIGALLIAVGLAPVFYDLAPLKKLVVPFTIIGLVVSVVSLDLFKHGSLPLLVIIPIILALLVPVLYYVPNTVKIVTNKVFFIAWASADIFSLEFMVYPTAFGGSINVNSLISTGPMASAYVAITVVGLVILAVLIALYSIAVRRKSALAVKTASSP
ncbi:MAG: hypothetical protein QXN26_03210 [Thermoplasmataceae archaeon]